MTTTRSILSGTRLLVFALAGTGFGALFDQEALRVSYFPMIFLFLLPFFLIRPLSGGGAFLEGTVFGLAANLLGIRWLLITMEDYGHLPRILSFGALFLFSAYLALFPAFFRAMTARLALFGPRLSPRALLFAPALWIVSEAGKTEILTGFPWNPLGSLLFGHGSFALAARIVGTTGLSFMIVLSTALIALSLDRTMRFLRTGRQSRSALFWTSLTVLVIGGWSVGGPSPPADAPGTPSIRVALVQGNIPPDQKWTPDHLRTDLGTYLALSREAIRDGARLLLWPETALPVIYSAPPAFVEPALTGLLHPGTVLVTGSIGEIPAPDAPMGVSFTNAAVLFEGEGRVRADYTKQHLVPFGEYLPLPAIFGWLRPLLGVGGDMAHADRPVRFALPEGVSLSPVICYEALYPSLVRNSLGNRAWILAVISDDAWFGRSSAPYQLFRESAMRAIEDGVPMIRAANTGLSGIVAPDGRILASGPLFTPAVVNATVPLPGQRTFYRRHGEWVLKLSLLGLLFWGAILPLGPRKNKEAVLAGQGPGGPL